MKTKLISTDTYLLLIDEEAEIKEEDYYHWKLTNTVQINRLFEEDRRLGRKGPIGHVSKVIAYRPLTKEAKELNLPLLPNPFDNQINEVTYLKNLGNECFLKMKELNPSGGIKEFIRMAVEFGYKAAQSKQKQFSLEDVVRIAHLWDNHINIHEEDKGSVKAIEKFIQSLSTQQLPKEFIPEYEIGYASKELTDKGFIYEEVFKTITNSEGKEVIQGTYKY